MNTFTTTLDPDAGERLRQHLASSAWEHRKVAHAQLAAKRPGLNVVWYTSGKLVVQGKGTEAWVEFTLEPEILLTADARFPNGAAPAPPPAPLPRVGIDESGKGDYFGPMVIAGFRITEATASLVSELRIQDSKRIKSDDRIAKLAGALEQQAPGDGEVLVLPPETYNRLVKKMGSVNRVLAWAHATVLENLLERHPDTTYAVADQFGPEHQIRSALKTRGKTIDLQQRHKAESDPAVAAASILARHGFVREMRKLGEWAGCELPLGATHVRPAAEDLVRRAGPEILTRLAKTHFRTTRQVLQATGHDPALLGTPEPREWKKR